MGAMFGALAIATPVSADLATCAKINNVLDRVSCYDQLSGRIPTKEVVKKPVGAGDWTVEIKKSAFEDTEDVYLSLDSTGTVQCRGIDGPQPVTLVVRCLENRTVVYIVAQQCHLTSGGSRSYGEVDFRIDTQKAFSQQMQKSNSNDALGHWRGKEAIPLAKRLFGGEKLLVRFTPYAENAKTAEFNISGLEEAVKPLRKSCGW